MDTLTGTLAVNEVRLARLEDQLVGPVAFTSREQRARVRLRQALQYGHEGALLRHFEERRIVRQLRVREIVDGCDFDALVARPAWVEGDELEQVKAGIRAWVAQPGESKGSLAAQAGVTRAVVQRVLAQNRHNAADIQRLRAVLATLI